MPSSIPETELKKLRQLMIDRVERDDPDRTAELALSGGIDSATVLFAMLETGRRPTCFTFYIKESPSEDLVSSRVLCEHFGLKLREVPLSWDMDQLVKDLKTLVPWVDQSATKRPSVYQCLHPWLYLYPAMESDRAFCGMGAEDHFCTSGKIEKLINTVAAEQKRQGKSRPDARAIAEQAAWDEGHRGVSYSSDLRWASGNIIKVGREVYGKTLIDLYGDYDELTKWFCRYPIWQLHDPFKKAATVYAFEDYFKQGRFLRKPSYYQINSGLKDMHEALLKESQYNMRGSAATIGIYTDIQRGLL